MFLKKVDFYFIMGTSEELLKKLRNKFEEVKKEVGFEVEYEDLNNAFQLDDYVLSLDFVSPNFSRQLCSRIVNFFQDWHHYLNNLLLPSSSYFAIQTESKLFKSV